MRANSRLRVGVASLAACGAAMIGVAIGDGSALAAGDANMRGCPAATEASPGFRAALPDCRAYELVSQGNSGDANNIIGSYGFPDGAHVYYTGFLPVPGGDPGSGVHEQFLATRTPSGWEQSAVSPPQGAAPPLVSLGFMDSAQGVSFTSDFSTAIVKSPFENPFEAPRLNETTGMGVYSLSIGSGVFSTLSLPDSGKLTPGTIEAPAAYAGFAEKNDWGSFLADASADGSRAFFVTTAKLATAAGTPPDTHEASDEIYERTGGHTYLVGVLPDGSVPACGAEVGQGLTDTLEEGLYSYGAVAPNGTNVVFFTPGPQAGFVGVPCNGGGLFLRDVVHGTTVPLPGTFFGGRAGTGAGEEEKIFTFDSETGAIYEYHVGTGEASEVGVGDLLAYSADGSWVYFLGETEEAIFVYHEGEGTRQIPRTEAGGYRAGASEGGGLIENRQSTESLHTRNMPVATPDGSHLLFIDTAKLTEYENKGHHEAYVYDAKTNEVTCVSCNPTPPQPQGEAQLIDEFSMDNANLQFQTPSPPFISNDGSRVVFETTAALVPQDTNGIDDVYEWEREGTNGCTIESGSYSEVIRGCIYLLSSGTGAGVPTNKGIVDGTHLVGASENLNDIYMQADEPLLAGADNTSQIYDVRVDGGFLSTETTYGCEPGQCKQEASVPAGFEAPASISLSGAGNIKATAAKHRPSKLSRRQRLARALKACKKRKGRRRRAACERAARRRYGARLADSMQRPSGGSR